jgi:UDP-glucuronate 4-epimerase
MKILVTGTAGFIGFHLVKALMNSGNEVVGIDNINDYYDVNLKYARLKETGINRELISENKKLIKSTRYENYQFAKIDITDLKRLEELFEKEQFTHVVNLAAQAGVRYSLENPHAYIQSNVVGFVNILECCRNYRIKHLVYASSSSVYGANAKIPFAEEDRVDHPVSLYAATKKSNELMAHTYSHLYNLPTTGLRFFTVYGPWGRPDMAMFLFTDAIENDHPIKVFNYGKMERDFTYINDIVEGLQRVVNKPIEEIIERKELYKIYNIGNNNSLKLVDFIKEIEINLGKEAKKTMMAIQPGDVERTWANVEPLIKDYDYKPNTSIKDGVKKFVEWYKKFYQKIDKVNY